MGRRRPWVAIGLLLALALGAGGGCALIGPGPPTADTPAQLAHRRELSRQAQAAFDRQDWASARAALEHLVAIEPRSAEAFQRLGRVWLAEQRPREAEAMYRRALEIDPDYPSALVGLGEAEAAQGRLQAAMEHLDSALEIDPTRSDAHLARGRTLESLGQYEPALAAYFRVLEFDPDTTSALVRVASIQLSRGRADEALARLDEVLEQAPSDPEAHLVRGRALMALRQPEKAVEEFRSASAALPGRADVFLDLATALAASKPAQPAEALRAAERARQLAPGWADAEEMAKKLRR
jgi:tetratricopeptide (TPR) repeat protein